jgi:hypothetical protein
MSVAQMMDLHICTGRRSKAAPGASRTRALVLGDVQTPLPQAVRDQGRALPPSAVPVAHRPAPPPE